ncbi:MAG: hypothetical protein ABWZ89_11880 [Acidimicrobiales bacterium]
MAEGVYRARTGQASFEEAYEQRQNDFINAVRQKVGGWRLGGRPDLTPTSRARSSGRSS